MANFESGFAAVLGNEGKFDHDPLDPGGMTVWGISRVHNPTLALWRFVDELLRQGKTEGQIAAHPHITDAVRGFYKKLWASVRGDQIMAQRNAIAVFDTVFNFGLREGTEKIQEALSWILGAGSVKIDGDFGPKTLAALNRINQSDDDFRKYLAALRIHHRVERVREKPTQIKWLEGWYNRDTSL